MRESPGEWPSLPLADWQETYGTLHMYTQIVGKLRLALSPMVNHWWQVPLYVTARGLTTSPIPYEDRVLQADFDFFDHVLQLQTSTGDSRRIPLGPAVKDFYHEVMAVVHEWGIEAQIWTQPVEVPDPIPFEQDVRHAHYAPAEAHNFWQVLRRVDATLKEFRGRFTGKCSPVHFFWGSFDLAVTRFSGRPSPPPARADRMTRIGYNAELSSVGFWPGGRGIRVTVDGPAFYCYAYPSPPEFRNQPVRPSATFYHDELGQFLLKYDDVRHAPDPAQHILEFAQSTYEAGARLQGWPLHDLALHPGKEGTKGSPDAAGPV